MKAYEFRKYLLRQNITEADIKNHIDNVRRIEKALDKTAESIASVESVDSQLKWHVLPWKKKELLDSLKLYISFRSSYTKPVFYRTKVKLKECPECGLLTPLGSTYCKECGTLIGKTQFKQINEIYDSVEDKWINHRGMMIGIMSAIAALILAIIFFIVTAFPLPNIVGKDPLTASRILEEQGLSKESIQINCSGAELSVADITKGEYEVIAQEPLAGKKVHKSTKIIIDCKDLYKERSNAIQDCRYSEVSKAEDTAKDYKYNYEIKIIDENLSDKEKLYVAKVTNQDDDNRTVIFEVDSEKNISDWIEGVTTEYIGRPAAEGQSLEKKIDCEVDCINYEKEAINYYDDNIGDYQITGINDFDIINKKLSIAVDTKSHLEELDFISSLKMKIPYDGMLEDYIDETGAGKHTDELYGEEDDSKDYIWKSPDGKYDVLTVTCENGEVVNVRKDNEEAFWQGDLPDYSVDADAIYAELDKIEKEKQAKLEADAEKYAAAARDKILVEVTSSTGTYHIDGCSDIIGVSTWESTYGRVKNGHHACMHCNPDTYCERLYEDYKREFILKEGNI